jgi:diguanylate cyclase (GGDEF)-like protein
MEEQSVRQIFAARPVVMLVSWMTARSRTQAVGVVLGALVAIAALDFLTGPRLIVAPLYIFPLCVAAWTLGARAGLVTGILGAGITMLLEGQPGPLRMHSPLAEQAVATWNMGVRFLMFAVVVLFVATFRRIFETERRRGNTDILTGAYNRLALNARIAATVALAQRHRLTLILAYTDLDGFKAVNDTHGHAAGDDVLKTFASAASASIRRSDSLCRVGGDEFVILMTTASTEHGYIAAEHLHIRLTKILETLPYEVTCSMGAVIFENNIPETPELFLQHADTLMYEVKKSGKNALRIAHGIIPSQVIGAQHHEARRQTAAARG